MGRSVARMSRHKRTYPHGVPSWIDLRQPDLAASCEFYAGLLGWTFEVVGGGTYVVARLDGTEVAGLMEGPSEGWSTYVAVDDADGTAALVAPAGGQVLEPVSDVGRAGRTALVEDPAGARLRLWQAGERLGVQATNEPGAWNFSDLHGVGADAVEAFYARLFGWETTDVGFGRMIRRPGYGDHLAATVDPGIHERQSEVGAPPGFADAVGWLVPGGDEPPHWHVTLTVADRDSVAGAVEGLGGTVVRSEDTGWTRTALVRDPQGAELTISQFTPPPD